MCITLSGVLPCQVYHLVMCITLSGVLPWQVFFLVMCITLSGVLPCQVYHLVRCITLSGVLPCQVYYLVRCITLTGVLPCQVYHLVRCITLTLLVTWVTRVAQPWQLTPKLASHPVALCLPTQVCAAPCKVVSLLRPSHPSHPGQHADMFCTLQLWRSFFGPFLWRWSLRFSMQEGHKWR